MANSFDDELSPPPRRPAPAGARPARAPAPQLSVLALLSLLSGLAAVPTFCIVFLSMPASLTAIVLGHLARRDIRQSNGTKTGGLVAIFGLLLGYGMFFVSSAILALVFLAPRSPSQENGPRELVGLRLAETKIVTDADGAAHGNTPEAKQLAERFATVMEAMHDTAFTKTKAKIKLTGGHYVTWCELRPGQCAFVVHVPEYRRFDKEAKEVLSELAWRTAQAAVAGTLQEGDRLAVGLKGVALYGSVMVGTVADEEQAMNRISQKSTKKELLAPFFGNEGMELSTGASEDEGAADGEFLMEEEAVDSPPENVLQEN